MAIALNGSTQYATAGDVAGLEVVGNQSYSFFIKSTSSADMRPVSLGPLFALSPFGAGSFAILNPDSTAWELADSTTYTPGTWLHFGMTFAIGAPGVGTFYCGGVADGTMVLGAAGTPFNTGAKTIGAYNPGTPEGFLLGDIGQVCVWPVTLDATAMAHAAAGRNPMNTTYFSAPLDYWPLLTTADLASLGTLASTLTLVGSPSTASTHPTVDAPPSANVFIPRVVIF